MVNISNSKILSWYSCVFLRTKYSRDLQSQIVGTNMGNYRKHWGQKHCFLSMHVQSEKTRNIFVRKMSSNEY